MKGKNIGDNNGIKNRITVRDLRDGKFHVLDKDEFNKDKYNKITKKGYYVGNRSKIKNF